jgi:hypothetical protein
MVTSAGAKLLPADVGCDSRHQADERGEHEDDTGEASSEQLHAPHLQSCERDRTGSDRAASGRTDREGTASIGGTSRVAENAQKQSIMSGLPIMKI